ncbi:MAG: Na(+)-translocating NADH-quinone reductase subunit A [Bacteroidales bacterium]|nr:Na(+)-translocating NADH-quinone reductase subunit A [Bacteroidales bacterium]
METLKVKKGLNIAISGNATHETVSARKPQTVAMVPDDFHGLTPKVAVKEGDAVKVGSVLFFDKKHPELKVTSPVSGTVAEVKRGDRRKLLYISVNVAEEQTYDPFETGNQTPENIRNVVFGSGFGAFIMQRPYGVVANPEVTPNNIFVSAFDTAPLAADYNYVLAGKEVDVQTGLSALAKLTNGKVYYTVNKETNAALRNMKNVEVNEMNGPHPAGLVGTQINALCPINKGDVVWTMNIQDVALLGKFIRTGKIDFTKTIAVVGPEAKAPKYINTIIGAPVADIVNGNLINDKKLRIINGNVLTGEACAEGAFQNPLKNEITVIAEGDTADEMFGWIAPRFNMFSNSNLFTAKLARCLNKNKTFKFDARILGGERAFIASNEIEKVFPLDIMPEQLVKAMIAKNLDKMEQLGAYEIIPEDFALCEYVCTSKIEIQHIVRESLDYMRNELE